MDAHYHLAQKLNAHPTGAPGRLELLEILRLLFTPEEADLAVHLGWRPEPADRIAQKAGLPAAQVAALCERMADKGLVYALSLHERTVYALLPTAPGLFEDPLMIGSLPGVDMERLGQLWNQYYENGWGHELHGSPTNFARVLPHEGSVAEQVTVLPFEEAAKYIDEATHISLGNCSCRLAKKGCDNPIDVCLGFGSAARFLAERKGARLIDKAEAHAVLRRAEELGLVHCASNTEAEIDFLCACCPCCCVLLGAVTRLQDTASRPQSNFYSTVDETLCTGCAICEDRCPVRAIAVNGTAKVDTALCIGCGLCATACPDDAVALWRKSEVIPPHDHAAYHRQVADEKGRRELFQANLRAA